MAPPREDVTASSTYDEWDALEGALLGSSDVQASMTDDSIKGGRPMDSDYSSLDMECSFLMRTGREPTQEEIMEYLERHNLQAFLTDLMMYVARHFPPDPLDFLLDHIHAMVMKHRAAQTSGAGASVTKVETSKFPPTPKSVAFVSADQRLRVVQHVAAALREDGTTRACGAKVFEQFATGDKLIEDGFGKLLAHLESSWGLQSEDCKLMSETLKRWRFRSNAAKGTRGLPLWPLAKGDFVSAYGSLLRSVRDRYVPIGGQIHRSLFVRHAVGNLEDSYTLGPRLGRGAFGEVRLVTLKATRSKRVCKRVERKQQKVPEEDLPSEVDLLRGLDHPHIIRVFEFFETEDFVDMIMEPVFGGTLSHVVQGLYCGPDGEYIEKRPDQLQETWIAIVMSQLLSALEYAHTVSGIIHKDIKADNVLLVAG
jgi:hypothetical protein